MHLRRIENAIHSWVLKKTLVLVLVSLAILAIAGFALADKRGPVLMGQLLTKSGATRAPSAAPQTSILKPDFVLIEFSRAIEKNVQRCNPS